MFRLMDKKIILILRSKNVLIWVSILYSFMIFSQFSDKIQLITPYESVHEISNNVAFWHV